MSRFISSFRVLPVCLAVFASLSAHAQTPDAGAIQQQIDRERQLQLPSRTAPPKAVAPAEMKAKGNAVTVREFRFSGNTLLPAERLTPVLMSYLNRPLDFSQLQAAAAAVAEAYREAGWVVRVYLPAQDIQDGIVTLQVVEAVLGRIKTSIDNAARVKPAQVLAIFERTQKTGEFINNNMLDRALLLADDLPGITVAGSFQQGQQSGETDLHLKLAAEPIIVGEVTLDNTGSRSTGEERISANLGVNSPLGVGDLLIANGIHTRGSDYLRLAFSVPIGAEGWRVGVNTSHLYYKLIAPEFRVLNVKGNSQTFGLEANYPLLRSRLANLFFNVNFDIKEFDNQVNGFISTRYTNKILTVATSGNLFDNFAGGGANAAVLALSAGDLDLNGSPNKAADAASTQTAGRYSKLRWSLSRQQVITQEVSAFASYSGQRANKNLDSSERFYLGGVHGVRAYPTSEGGGAEGDMLNLELRWKLPKSFILTGFYDYGNVKVNRRNNYIGAANPNSQTFKGYGVELAWATPASVMLKAAFARRDGKNPNPTVTGNDQDGSLIKNRWWISASLPF